MKSCFIVPDSSFFICFLNDINSPQYLIKFIYEDKFHFMIGNIVKKEIKKSICNHEIIDKIELKVDVFEYYEFGEIIRPFFSIEEIRKGEHEVIVISYILSNKRKTFLAILDEKPSRNFLKKFLPKEASNSVIGTIGFIRKCTIEYNILSIKEGIDVLLLIKKSKFRIENSIIDEVIDSIEGCKNGY